MSMSGDAGLAMSMGPAHFEKTRFPVKPIVFKDDSLAFVELE